MTICFICMSRFRFHSLVENSLFRDSIQPHSLATQVLFERWNSWLRFFWFPRMKDFVKRFVCTCDICCRSKSINRKPAGLLQPLKTPGRPWTAISMDFIVKLPLSSGFDSIWTIVDFSTRLTHLVPVKESMTALEFASLYVGPWHFIHFTLLDRDLPTVGN